MPRLKLAILKRLKSTTTSFPARARRRSIELFPLSFFYADPMGARPGLVIGYGALPEHDLEAGFEALCDVLAGVTA